MEKPWETEPDRLEYEERGYDCLVRRINDLGSLCGYVALMPSHPWYGKHYGEIPLDVHGGLTYSDYCGGDICHEAPPARDGKAYWIGFDCAHTGDYIPGMRWGINPDAYKDINFVKGQISSMIDQIIGAEKNVQA